MKLVYFNSVNFVNIMLINIILFSRNLVIWNLANQSNKLWGPKINYNKIKSKNSANMHSTTPIKYIGDSHKNIFAMKDVKLQILHTKYSFKS